MKPLRHSSETRFGKLRPFRAAAISVALLLRLFACGQGRDPARNAAFLHGRWFDGNGFVATDFYSADGRLTASRPERIDTSVDLTGKFIVPPFGEAHNHNIDGFKKVDERIRRYLSDGIYYVKNPNSIPRYTKTLAGSVNTPSSVDVIFSNGGLTCSDGHPLELVRRNIGLGIFTQEDGEGGMYYIIDSLADLDRKWEKILADRPGFIKTYLLYSEDFSRRRNDTAYFGWKGLDPKILGEIVSRAHRAGLSVTAHIETAADFHNALQAGIDEINHMPGFRADSNQNFSRYEISEEDAARAGRRGTVVVTTLAGSTSGSGDYGERLRRLHIRNLGLLKKYGVRMAVGSDAYRQTSVQEAMYLSGLGVFTNAELLRIWSENTDSAIFPRRKIGRLAEGYDASFLALDADPLKDFMNTQKISCRVKEGKILTPR